MKRLLRKIRTKLRSPRGETLGEVLVALLVAALAITMLAGAIGVSTRLVQKSKVVMNDYYLSNNDLSSGSGSTTSNGTVSFGTTKLVASISDSTRVPVKVTTNAQYESVVSYHKG